MMSPCIARMEEVRTEGDNTTRIIHATYDYGVEDQALAQLSSAQPDSLAIRQNLMQHRDIDHTPRDYHYQHHLLTGYSNYNGHRFALTWTSLQALQARWQGAEQAPEDLQQQHPINIDNSYQARALQSGAADGSTGVSIDYVNAYSSRVQFIDGGTFDYYFNEQWLNTRVDRITPDGQAIAQGQLQWDDDGMLIGNLDAHQNLTRYDYDANGNLTYIEDASGASTTLEYDAHNQPVVITNALGHRQQMHYDNKGQLISTIDAQGHTTDYHYDDDGQLIRVTDAKGADKHLHYDAYGNLVQYDDCSAKQTHYNYDEHQRLILTTDALGHTTHYAYNRRHQLVVITHPDSSKEYFEYDGEDNLTEYTDAKGLKTRYRYNIRNLPIERTDPNGQLVTYQYDGEERLIQLTNGNGEHYRLVYGDQGLLIEEIGFDGKRTHYHYDKAKHLIATVHGEHTTEWHRDPVGRLVRKHTGDGSTRYAYDPLGQLTHILSPNSQHHLQYNALGQLTQERTAYFIEQALTVEQQNLLAPLPTPDAQFTLNHQYDELGDRIDTLLPNGRRISTLRYGSGHWHSLLWNQQPLTDIERDDLHRERRRTLGRGKTPNISSQRDYDPQSRLSSLQINSHYHTRQRDYQWNTRGELDRISDQQYGTTDYRYDPLGQLLSAQHPDRQETFAFDPAGNLLDPSLVAHPSDQAQSHRPTHSDSAADSEQPPAGFRPQQTPRLGKVMHNLLTKYLHHHYDYDANGNTLRKRQPISANDEAILHCDYDSDNRLIRSHYHWPLSQTSEPECHYTYDAFGRRIAKRTVQDRKETQRTFFVWYGVLLFLFFLLALVVVLVVALVTDHLR